MSWSVLATRGRVYKSLGNPCASAPFFSTTPNVCKCLAEILGGRPNGRRFHACLLLRCARCQRMAVVRLTPQRRATSDLALSFAQ